MLGYHIARDVFAAAPPDPAAGATTPADRMFGSGAPVSGART